MEVASAMRMAAALVAVVAVMVRPSPGSPSSVAWQQPCRCHGTRVRRVVEMAGPVLAPDGTTELVAVLLAPKGSREGVWVAVPPENLTIE